MRQIKSGYADPAESVLHSGHQVMHSCLLTARQEEREAKAAPTFIYTHPLSWIPSIQLGFWQSPRRPCGSQMDEEALEEESRKDEEPPHQLELTSIKAFQQSSFVIWMGREGTCLDHDVRLGLDCEQNSVVRQLGGGILLILSWRAASK